MSVRKWCVKYGNVVVLGGFKINLVGVNIEIINSYKFLCCFNYFFCNLSVWVNIYKVGVFNFFN